MPDQEFKILITGDASSAVAATQQASAGLGKIKIDTSDLKDETKNLLGINTPAVEKVKEVGAAAEKTGEKMGGSGREVRRLANELGNMLGISDLGMASLGQFGVAAFAASVALGLLKHAIGEIQADNKGALSLDFHADPAPVRNITAALDDYAAAKQKVLDAYNSVEAAAGRENQDLAAKLKLFKDLLKAEEDEAEAALAAKKDQMSPQAYAAAQAGLKGAFAGQGAAAEQQEKQDEINNRRKEADAADADAAKKQAAAAAITPGNDQAVADAQKNADDAKKNLDEINRQLAMVKRLRRSGAGKEVPEYQGAEGVYNKGMDAFDYSQHFFGHTGDQAQADLEQQKAQAAAAIALAKRAADEQARLKEKQKGLADQAGEESGKAATLRADADRDQAQLDREKQNQTVVSDIGTAGNVIGQAKAAEGNNTAQGQRDQIAAIKAASSVQEKLQKDLLTATDKQHEVIVKTLSDLTARTNQLTAQMKNLRVNTF